MDMYVYGKGNGYIYGKKSFAHNEMQSYRNMLQNSNFANTNLFTINLNIIYKGNP